MTEVGPDLSTWLTSAQACERLGVRPQTLYAYVSRGLLASEPLDGRSRYDPVQIDELARRTARGRRPGRFEVTIDTEITRLERSGRLSYRGVDVASIVGRWSFERTAEWLWTGIDRGEPARPWRADAERLQVLRGVLAALPDDTPPGDRLRVAVAAMGTTAPRRAGRQPEAARTLIATLVEALPLVGAAAPEREASIAARLWPRSTARPATPAGVALLDATLVTLADHELATSTLAVRVATSTAAGLEAALLAGLATLGGPLHGSAAEPVRRMLADARRRGAPAAIDAAARDGRVPGVGHAVYDHVDPRTALLLERLDGVASPTRGGAVRAVVAELERRSEAPINVDLALGAVLDAGRMVPGAAEVVFGVARSAGWVAHAREEARHRLRYRARAVYTGPR